MPEIHVVNLNNAMCKDEVNNLLNALGLDYLTLSENDRNRGCEAQNMAQSTDNAPRSANMRQVGGEHYITQAIQPWAAMQAWMSSEAFRGFLLGNVIKYAARDKGNKYEDLKKAHHYLSKLIEEMGKEPKQSAFAFDIDRNK